MKKVFLLIFSILLITGCSAKYHVVINEDLSLIEEAKLTGTTDFFNNYYKTTKKNVLKSFLDIYKDVLDENNYKYELIEDETPYISLSRKYTSVNEYVNNSKLFNGYFDEVKYTENGDIKRIETVGFNENNPDDPERFNISELEISITCPYVVKDNNAKKVNQNTNTYYYELNEDNNKIILEYDVSKKFNPNKDLIRTLIICFLIVVGTWIMIIISSKNKSKSK